MVTLFLFNVLFIKKYEGFMKKNELRKLICHCRRIFYDVVDKTNFLDDETF